MCAVLDPLPERAPGAPHADASFAHNAERQLAKLLDFYGVRWEYEPRTFVLDHDDDGNPTRGFTPDFYLPAFDLYIEITTLSQKLVTKKNAKVRQLRELHPEVRIRIIYQRDYVGLLEKYGLEQPEQWRRPGSPPGSAVGAKDSAGSEIPVAS